MTFQAKVIAGTATALAVLLIVAVLSRFVATHNDDDIRWVNHTHVVLERLGEAQSNVSDAEASQRGYLLTGDGAYLIAYTSYIDQLKKKLQIVRDLTADNPIQQQALNDLEPLVHKQLAALDQRIDLRRNDGLGAAAAAMQTDAAKPLTKELREALSRMDAEERMLLVLRSNALEASSRRIWALIVGGNALGLLLLSIAGFLVYQEMKHRRVAEAAVRTLNAELEAKVAERTAELAERAKDLERSNMELQQFAYVASHDLQEPLRTISSFTQLLAKRYREKLDDKAREFIDFAVDGCKRMQAQINDLLAFSRVGTLAKPLLPVSCDLALDRVLKMFKTAIDESKAIITRDPLPVVLADEGQLCQLFQNLIGNAMKFRGSDSPKIHISAVSESTDWKILVQDNGIGIAPEHGNRIFVIFQRLHTKKEYPGTGIGLAICKKIAERHGGRIWFEPTPGGGTTFCFTVQDGKSNSKETKDQNELRLTASAD